jgi:hypothetical protein
MWVRLERGLSHFSAIQSLRISALMVEGKSVLPINA